MTTVIVISIAILCILWLYMWRPWNCLVCEKRGGWFSNPGQYTDLGPICAECKEKGR